MVKFFAHQHDSTNNYRLMYLSLFRQEIIRARRKLNVLFKLERFRVAAKRDSWSP